MVIDLPRAPHVPQNGDVFAQPVLNSEASEKLLSQVSGLLREQGVHS